MRNFSKLIFLLLLTMSFHTFSSSIDLSEKEDGRDNLSLTVSEEEIAGLEEALKNLTLENSKVTTSPKEIFNRIKTFEEPFTADFYRWFSSLDHLNIIKNLVVQGTDDLQDKNILNGVYRHYYIYNSMFPAIYESEDISKILAEENCFSQAICSLKSVETFDLKDICNTLTEMYETEYFRSFYERVAPNLFYRDWLSLALILSKNIEEKRSVLSIFISYLPETFSASPKKALKKFTEHFNEINRVDDFSVFSKLNFSLFSTENEKIDHLIKIIKDNNNNNNILGDDYHSFREHLLEWREKRNIKQYELATFLGVAPSTLSRFLTGKIKKSPMLLTHYREKVGFPQFKR